MVASVPDRNALAGVPVNCASARFIAPPPKATRPCDSSIMPIRNRPSPPANGKTMSCMSRMSRRSGAQVCFHDAAPALGAQLAQRPHVALEYVRCIRKRGDRLLHTGFAQNVQHREWRTVAVVGDVVGIGIGK